MGKRAGHAGMKISQMKDFQKCWILEIKTKFLDSWKYFLFLENIG